MNIFFEVEPWADYGKGFEAQRSMSQSEGSASSWPSGLERMLGVVVEMLNREGEFFLTMNGKGAER